MARTVEQITHDPQPGDEIHHNLWGGGSTLRVVKRLDRMRWGPAVQFEFTNDDGRSIRQRRGVHRRRIVKLENWSRLLADHDAPPYRPQPEGPSHG